MNVWITNFIQVLPKSKVKPLKIQTMSDNVMMMFSTTVNVLIALLMFLSLAAFFYLAVKELIKHIDNVKVDIQMLTSICFMPIQGTPQSNGYDCFLNISRITKEVLGDKYQYIRGCSSKTDQDGRKTLILKPDGKVIIPLGFRFKLPNNISVDVLHRSGFALKTDYIIPNSPGLVDTDYRGEVCVILRNISDEPIIIKDFERICQIAFVRRPNVVLRSVDNIDTTGTVRGINGHGHTNNKTLSDSPIVRKASETA